MNLTAPQSEREKVTSPLSFQLPPQSDPVTTHTGPVILKLLLPFLLQSQGQAPVKAPLSDTVGRTMEIHPLSLTISPSSDVPPASEEARLRYGVRGKQARGQIQVSSSLARIILFTLMVTRISYNISVEQGIPPLYIKYF